MLRPSFFNFGLIIFILVCSAFADGYAQTLYITNTGEKYHKEGCQYLRRSKIETTVLKAIELGYTACSVCKPSADKVKRSKTSTVSKQCSAKTNSAKQCSRMTKEANGRCWQHQ